MSLRRLLALMLTASLASPVAWAQGDDDDEEEEADDEGEDEGGEDDADEEEGEPAPKKAAKKKKKDEPFVKQNLSGHDLGTTKKENQFEKDRFFADKVDSDKTADGTLIQGSLTSSTFAFTESGGSYGVGLGDNSARFGRYFTELRLQTDFRHIKASRWEARIDARARVVNTPADGSGNPASVSADPTRIQSGFNGTNEYDLRELWLFRSGKRSDIFFGRQWIADLGAVKFDGLRVDYASSRKLTLMGFGGLYPLRGSRSVTTDYPQLKDNDGNSAGRLVGTGGFGAAYRTDSAYGAIGGVALVPFAGEQPRIYATSTGYYRSGSALDVYHFALVDLVSFQGAGLTNLSAGINYKPGPRLRLTANFNRVDVDTLAVQANAFLTEPDVDIMDPAYVGNTIVQNETYFRRLASNVARVGVSAGLGHLQRFEISTQVAYRHRPGVSIPVGGGQTTIELQSNRGIDVYGSITDRRSFKNLRLGLDASRSKGIGAIAYQRSEVLAIRAFAARELANGHGEWEAEISYANTKDSASGIDCSRINTCYGASTGAIVSGGGNVYYRLNRDWYGVASLFVSRQTLTYYRLAPVPTDPPVAAEDPAVTGLMGFFRAAYRF